MVPADYAANLSASTHYYKRDAAFEAFAWARLLSRAFTCVHALAFRPAFYPFTIHPAIALFSLLLQRIDLLWLTVKAVSHRVGGFTLFV